MVYLQNSKYSLSKTLFQQTMFMFTHYMIFFKYVNNYQFFFGGNGHITDSKKFLLSGIVLFNYGFIVSVSTV
jgi:hypothetical protein